MASEHSDVKLEIGHVLFIDIVGYSKLLITEQSDQLQTLKSIVRGTEQVKQAEAEGKLLRLPTGDGGALVFRNRLEAPVLCALEISKALRNYPELRVRMGIHSGPVNEISDLNEQANIAGAGINMAQRVMDCGDTGHILLSRHVAEDLEQYPQWRSHLAELGECEVKHGARVSVVNLYTDDAGNAAVPARLADVKKTPAPSRARLTAFQAMILGVILVIGLGVPVLFFTPAILKSLRSGQSAAPSSPAPALPSSVPEKSIAVLPFENLSDDKSNAYFADGIQDEILTRLAKIADLKVISRTSTQKYKSAPDNLREVGKQLGVANLLEGSVQKIANAVHVNVQLIRAATDGHLWAESYNRKLDDVFGVEGEIAQTVAEALNAKLTGTEKQILVQKPTNNPAAYDAYLRGTSEYLEMTEDSGKAAVHSFEEAVRLDPQFAGAWAALSRAHSLTYFHYDVTPSRRAAAEKALAAAMRLQPDLAETQLAAAYLQYWVVHDYKGALETMQRLRSSWPSNAEILRVMAFISARLGQWQNSVDYITQSVALDPRDRFTATQAIQIRLATRDFETVVRLVDAALKIWPNDVNFIGFKALAFQARGQLDEAQSILKGVTPNVDDFDADAIAIWHQARLRRNPEIAFKFYQPVASETHWTVPGIPIYWAELQEMSGEKNESQATFARVRDDLVARLKGQPDNAELVGPLAHCLAWLGERDAALSALDKFATLGAEDARASGIAEELRARILTRFGDKDGAVASLERVLARPHDGIFGTPLTPALLQLDPDFDPLRGDPRFEKLCQKKTK